MKIKTYLLITFLIGILILSGCDDKTAPDKKDGIIDKQVPSDERTIFEIKLIADAPFSTATLIIYEQALLEGDAVIEYEAQAQRMGIEKQTDSKRITLEEFNELANLIIKNDFFSLEEIYIDKNLMDATRYTIIVSYFPEGIVTSDAKYAKNHSVSCYGTCPEEFIKIIDKIKELWEKEILEVGM